MENRLLSGKKNGSPLELTFIGIVLVLVIGLGDYLTGYEISVSVFYLAPISLATWYGGQSSGIVVAIAGAIAWLIADIGAGHKFSHPVFPLWNAGVLLASFVIMVIILERLKRVNEKQTQIVSELREALDNVKTLKGMIPICAWCKKIRDDEGYWREVEAYITMNSDASFTHGMCRDCRERIKEQHRYQCEKNSH